MSDRRLPSLSVAYKIAEHEPLSDEGLVWLADQICAHPVRVHPDRTTATGWLQNQAVFELPHLVTRLTELEADNKALVEALEDTETICADERVSFQAALKQIHKIVRQALTNRSSQDG